MALAAAETTGGTGVLHLGDLAVGGREVAASEVIDRISQARRGRQAVGGRAAGGRAAGGRAVAASETIGPISQARQGGPAVRGRAVGGQAVKGLAGQGPALEETGQICRISQARRGVQALGGQAVAASEAIGRIDRIYPARLEGQAGDMDGRAHRLECDRLYRVEVARAVVEGEARH